jgi:N-methylhydantoinase A/oxoprolinase/acetone carboxylase beta subunit
VVEQEELSVQAQVRIGIDVGGTFTHAVAVNSQTLAIVGKSKVPTTHRAKEGVALGIVQALQKLLLQAKIAPEEVNFIAHSTTQATNALLEGDLVKVGIIALAYPSESLITRRATKLGRVPVADGCYLETEHCFLPLVAGKPNGGLAREKVLAVVNDLRARGCAALAITQAFSVDNAEVEIFVAEIAREAGMLATAGSEVSQLYGLKVRTRTAAINAGILPKMIESANLTEQSVRQAQIKAPIMIMRSDGGVMDIEAMRRRPILSILSGPAAGVAAAMMFLRISDGIFLEVGGTSTDISAIANGRALVRSAQIGGHRIYMRTLDVRTVGVAGGSLCRIDKQAIKHVGPRSAHIAGFAYAAFSEAEDYLVETCNPLPKDPKDYLVLSKVEEPTAKVSITPTCASNLLGFVPEGDSAGGNLPGIKKAFLALARYFNMSDENASIELAQRILKLASDQCIPVVKALIQEHKLDPQLVKLVGGGGGACAIVPACAQAMNLRCEIAEHADVISAIGVAMALIRETVERQVANAAEANETILLMRQEVFESVHKMGADPATIEVFVEIDSKTSIVRATASGATKLLVEGSGKIQMSDAQRMEVVAGSMRKDVKDIEKICATDNFEVFVAILNKSRPSFWATLRHWLVPEKRALRVVDRDGVIRLQAADGDAIVTTAGAFEEDLRRLLELHATWGDAGKTIPSILLLASAKIIDLSGLLDESQVLTLARAELATMPGSLPVIFVAKFT